MQGSDRAGRGWFLRGAHGGYEPCVWDEIPEADQQESLGAAAALDLPVSWEQTRDLWGWKADPWSGECGRLQSVQSSDFGNGQYYEKYLFLGRLSGGWQLSVY